MNMRGIAGSMPTGRKPMNPISKTAFYCCGSRMLDAEAPNPICGDTYARLFMDEEALAYYAPFRQDTRRAASNVTRSRIVEDVLRRELAKDKTTLVVSVGAGFDSRPYRIEGGDWLELDEPQIVSYKNGRLPIEECRSRLERIAIDFLTESLADKLAPYAGRQPVIVVVEGVFAYLQETQIVGTLEALKAIFPKHLLICDLVTDAFWRRYNKGFQDQLGATVYTVADPASVFLTHGYRETESVSVLARAVALRALHVPMPLRLLARIFPSMRKRVTGYRIHVFASI
jgi:methyltransferase (TIGR00027 family)